tara:strand:- start:131 stop:571 length:441 start_codon:yes stop_codon:yes gene_type:complete
MIISCENCGKKFEVSDDLIPENGRFLQCGSCSHKWHYVQKDKKKILENNQPKIKSPIKSSPDTAIKNEIKPIDNEDVINDEKNIKSSKNNFLNIFLALIISFVAIIILADTFKNPLSLLLPNIDNYLKSLYESLTDIFLFFKDLLK